MKSSRDDNRNNTVLKTKATSKRIQETKEERKKILEQGNEDDEDEMDAMDTYNPFGGGYKYFHLPITKRFP